MYRSMILGRVAPMFLAGFLATASLLSGTAGIFGATVVSALQGSVMARLFAEPAITILDLVASLVGGAAAAVTYGRAKSHH